MNLALSSSDDLSLYIKIYMAWHYGKSISYHSCRCPIPYHSCRCPIPYHSCRCPAGTSEVCFHVTRLYQVLNIFFSKTNFTSRQAISVCNGNYTYFTNNNVGYFRRSQHPSQLFTCLSGLDTAAHDGCYITGLSAAGLPRDTHRLSCTDARQRRLSVNVQMSE